MSKTNKKKVGTLTPKKGSSSGVSGFGSGTEILMVDGSMKCIEEIEVDDEVMWINGKPKTVISTSKSKCEMYEVTPQKGQSYIVSGDHLLVLRATNLEMIWWDKRRSRWRIRWLENFTIVERSFAMGMYDDSKSAAYKVAKKALADAQKRSGYTMPGAVVVIKASRFMKLSRRIQNCYKGFSRGLDFEEKDVLDPYVLGYWLGDGDSSGPGITTAEEEIVEYFDNFASENMLQFRYGTNYRYNLTTATKYGGHGRNMFKNFLNDYELINNKHIPNDYLMNSRENRLKLLAGLVDSDGHNSNNTYDFVFKSEQLTDDVIFLARSLGFKCFKVSVKKTCTNSSKGRVIGDYFRFCIHGEGLEKIPSLLKRKKTHARETKKNALVTQIRVKAVGKKDCYHFELDNSKRCLLADFTVVHN